jgi:hypothetical protein
MATASFRDRFFTPPVARATMSPAAILVAGAGASVAVLVGLPALAAVGAGALAWAARVAFAVPKAEGSDVDPYRLPDPWRTFVFDATQSRRRFGEAVARGRAGPLQERLDVLGGRIDAAVEECWRIAQAGAALDEARASIDVGGLQFQLQSLNAAGHHEGAAQAATREALAAQLATAARLDATIDDASSQLQLLDARLGEAVTRAIELTARGTSSDVGVLDEDVDGLVLELEALRQALAETTADPAVPTAPGWEMLEPPT